MDPTLVDHSDTTISSLARGAGPLGVAAFAIGIVVLVLSLRAASRRGPRSHAYALFAAAWLAALPVLGATSVGELPLLAGALSRGRDAEITRLMAGPRPEPATTIFCAAGLLVGLAGAVAAIARSRAEVVTVNAPSRA